MPFCAKSREECECTPVRPGVSQAITLKGVAQGRKKCYLKGFLNFHLSRLTKLNFYPPDISTRDGFLLICLITTRIKMLTSSIFLNYHIMCLSLSSWYLGFPRALELSCFLFLFRAHK